MKHKTLFILTCILLLSTGKALAQNENWGNKDTLTKHRINIGFGAEYGVVYSLGYGYKFKTKTIPIMAFLQYSFPSGNKVFDDYKGKLGLQANLLTYRNFKATANISGVYRRYTGDYVRLLNFGTDWSAILGYYRKGWFLAGEVGFDKAIVTNFKHKQAYRNQFPGVVDGWYEPATGGNFYYGLQTGLSIKHHDIFIKAGKLLTQDFKIKPMLPFYGQIAYGYRF